MSVVSAEQSSEPQANGHHQSHQSPSSARGFTAVNGFPSSKPLHVTSNTDDATSPRRESYPSRTYSIPDANAPSKTNSTSSSPTATSTRHHRPSSSSDSTHSPPIRKRTYPEAFGEHNHEHEHTATSPKRERRSEERREAGAAAVAIAPIAGTGTASATATSAAAAVRTRTSPDRELVYARHSQRSHAEDDDESEEQRFAAEALRRDGSSSGRRESAASLGDDQGYGDYEVTRAGIILEPDRKKRKRVFANRTKTGCLTCRKRKKKCDEAHPECNNCLRGGFVCEGYTTRNTWQKPSALKTPILLQSKEGPSSYQHTLSQALPLSASSDQVRLSGEHLPQVEGKLFIDDARHLSSPRVEGRPAWPNQAPSPYASSSHSSTVLYGQSSSSTLYGSGAADRSLEARASISKAIESGGHDYQHQEGLSYPALPMPPQRPTIPVPASAQLHQQSMHGPPPPSLPPPPAMAPPLLDPNSQRPVSHHRPESERDKMLRGEYFLPYTPALMADREQCALAVWRFNNSTNPATGIKPEDRMSFFQDIVNLRPTHDSSVPSGPPDANDPPIVGSIGSGVIVEAPFSCDYGYNISIGNDVVIGADCRITDTCSVHIGNNVVFSPGVRLMCATYAIDPKERKKGKGRALGRQIVIDDDVWIGSNVIILPGVKIGRCTTIGAGSLLHKDVPPYVVVAGNPPKVVRGIYDDGRAS